MFTIAAYMSAVARDWAADRGCTGGGKVAGRHGPARRNSGRVLFSGLRQLRPCRLASGDRMELGKSAAFGITVRPSLNLRSAAGD